jgi:glycosyl transferase family 2
MSDFRVVAIVSAFNEADIISPVIGHLVENGVDVYLIDNRSTDGTATAAKRWLKKGLIGIEQFPAEPPAGDGPPAFDWEGILRRKEVLAKELEADWFIHHDADEFREPPWPGMNLRDAIRWVDGRGYNCIDFRVLNFPPLEAGFEPGTDPGDHFTHWEDPVIYDTLQRKAWKAQKTGVSLAASGGHEAQFPDRRVFPIRFLMRHYPIRSQEHGRRKVFDERKKRFVEKERAKGWHVQYDSITDEGHSFVGDPARLHPYDPDRTRLELMVNSEPVQEARRQALELAGALASKHESEKHAENLARDREKLTRHLIERERHVANLETLKAEAEREAITLRAEHAEMAAGVRERETHLSNLKREVAELKRHASAIEHDRRAFEGQAAELQRHAANLENRIEELRRHAAGLENDRKTLAAHVAHLEEVRAENDRHVRRLEELRASREAEAANASARLAEIERHAAGLEKDREKLAAHISHLEAVRVDKDRHIALLQAETKTLHAEMTTLHAERVDRAELEGRRLELQARVDELAARSRDLEDRFSAMRSRANREEGLRREAEDRALRSERDLATIHQSTVWRMTAPARWIVDLFKRALRA